MATFFHALGANWLPTKCLEPMLLAGQARLFT
jgi:hypothetical protein